MPQSGLELDGPSWEHQAGVPGLQHQAEGLEVTNDPACDCQCLAASVGWGVLVDVLQHQGASMCSSMVPHADPKSTL